MPNQGFDEWYADNEGKVLVSVDGREFETHDFIQNFEAEWPLDKYDLVVGASDGVFSFTSPNGTPVPWNNTLIDHLLDFQGMAGEFMVRHLRGVVGELREEGIVNQDDISMIGVYDNDS
jgi:hypothetical protein